jgi:hypothetical protein
MLYNRQDSKEAIIHRSTALRSVNKALINRDSGGEIQDESLTVVALLAGNEVS